MVTEMILQNLLSAGTEFRRFQDFSVFFLRFSWNLMFNLLDQGF